jgi:membrane protein
MFQIPPMIFEIANTLVSLGVTTFVFALLFKYLPQTKLAWRRIWPGALITAVLFNVGRVLIGVYLGKASVGSAYGAAGSVVALIVWVYYSAQIFFFGAEFTRVQAESGPEQRTEPRPEERPSAQPERAPAQPIPVAVVIEEQPAPTVVARIRPHRPPSKAVKIVSLASAVVLFAVSLFRQRRTIV